MDVFISYARPDEGQATRVADALRAAGCGVTMSFRRTGHMPK
jgi:hypothetical protein